MTLANSSAAVLGLFLHQAGIAYLNFDVEKYDAEEVERLRLPDAQWWDVAANLTYWHEVDHFQTFTCSPYLVFVTDMLECATSCVSTILDEVRDRQGWENVPEPLFFAQRDEPLSDELAFQLDLAWSLKLALHCALNSPQLNQTLADRLDWAAKVCAALKGWNLEGVSCRFDPGQESSLLTPFDLIEGLARLAELGHLTVWGASEPQLQFWARSCLVGRYGRAINPLMGRMDTDLIHACLVLAFRAEFHPFVGEPATLRHIHPVARFVDMINLLIETDRFAARGSDGRSTETRARFHDRVVDDLIDRFGNPTNAERFRVSEQNLWRRYLADPQNYRNNQRQNTGIATLLEEREVLMSMRDARFSLEASDGYQVWGEPTIAPWTIVFRDAVRNRMGVTEKVGETRQFLTAHLRLGLTQAVGDVMVFGDARLYALLSLVMGKPEAPHGFGNELLDSMNIERRIETFRAYSWRDVALNAAFGDTE